MLTCGEECQIAARIFSSFDGLPNYFNAAFGIAVVNGCTGVAVIRLKSNEWSAPCAFALTSPTNTVAANQHTLLLFMTPRSIISLVRDDPIILGKTHSFAPGPFTSQPLIQGVDVYIYLRFNSGYTQPSLIATNMLDWQLMEDNPRQRHWHNNLSWFDVLTNVISVDRSSVGNAFYLVIGLKQGRDAIQGCEGRNSVDVEELLMPPKSQNQQGQTQGQSYGQSQAQNFGQSQSGMQRTEINKNPYQANQMASMQPPQQYNASTQPQYSTLPVQYNAPSQPQFQAAPSQPQYTTTTAQSQYQAAPIQPRYSAPLAQYQNQNQNQFNAPQMNAPQHSMSQPQAYSNQGLQGLQFSATQPSMQSSFTQQAPIQSFSTQQAPIQSFNTMQTPMQSFNPQPAQPMYTQANQMYQYQSNQPDMNQSRLQTMGQINAMNQQPMQSQPQFNPIQGQQYSSQQQPQQPQFNPNNQQQMNNNQQYY